MCSVTKVLGKSKGPHFRRIDSTGGLYLPPKTMRELKKKFQRRDYCLVVHEHDNRAKTQSPYKCC